MGKLKSLANLLGAFEDFVAKARELGDEMNGTIDVTPIDESGEAQTVQGRKRLTAKRHQVHTIEQRVQKIIELVRKAKVDPYVQRATAGVLNRKCGDDWCVPEKDHTAEIRAIFTYVREHVRYMADPKNLDTFRAPRHTMRPVEDGGFAGGDCDDVCSVLASMLLIAGYSVKLRIMSVPPNPKGAWTHIFVRCGLPQRAPTKWISLDATLNKAPGFDPSRLANATRDFDVS